jgi:NADH-quinone oxidoreductase subunit J
MIYLGGILVLLLFGIMFTKRGSTKELISENRNTWLGGVLALAIFVGMGWIFWQTDIPIADEFLSSTVDAKADNIRMLGIALMTDHLVAFEVAGILLLAALIGAAYIAGKKTTPTD